MYLEQLNFETVAPVDGVKRKHAVQSQNVFKAVINKACSRGMRVNTAKTSLVVISDSLKYGGRWGVGDRVFHEGKGPRLPYDE